MDCCIRPLKRQRQLAIHDLRSVRGSLPYGACHFIFIYGNTDNCPNQADSMSLMSESEASSSTTRICSLKVYVHGAAVDDREGSARSRKQQALSIGMRMNARGVRELLPCLTWKRLQSSQAHKTSTRTHTNTHSLTHPLARSLAHSLTCSPANTARQASKQAGRQAGKLRKKILEREVLSEGSEFVRSVGRFVRRSVRLSVCPSVCRAFASSLADSLDPSFICSLAHSHYLSIYLSIAHSLAHWRALDGDTYSP